MPKISGEVKRGLAIKDEYWIDFLAKFDNDIVVSSEYWSSTVSDRVANEFMNRYPGNRVMLKIKSKTGSALSRYSNVVTESEVLFKPKSAFRVISKSTGDDGVVNIVLEELSNG